jgi:hypothetical protein
MNSIASHGNPREDLQETMEDLFDQHNLEGQRFALTVSPFRNTSGNH